MVLLLDRARKAMRFPGDQFGLMLRRPLGLSFETALASSG
jgi:hypothetical protein